MSSWRGLGSRWGSMTVEHGVARVPVNLRAALLILIVTVLEVLVFWGYLTGRTIPAWDFLGSYNTVAYIWWTDGSFFSPIDWIPNSLGGFPGALSLQISGWYLPVGVMSVFGPFTLHASAALSALHVAFGYFGTFALVRSFRLPYVVAILAAVAAFFAVGYFSNAAHVDIVRAYAWIPWVLYILSPKWPWKKWWAVPLAAFVLWQAVTGSYPGIVITFAYVGVVWVVAYQLISKAPFKQFLLPLAISGTIALLLSAPRLLPYFMLGGEAASAAELGDTSRFDLSLIGTLLYGYGESSGFPNDLSMNSFFIPASVLALAFFASMRDRIAQMALTIGIPAVLLGLPLFPWFQATQSLPGLDLSRFTMSDFKPFIILAAVLLACSGLQQLARRKRYSPRGFWVRFATLGLFALGLAAMRKEGPFTRTDWLPGFVILLVCIACIALLRYSSSQHRKAALAGALVGLTALSGVVWAHTTTLPWSHPRAETELNAYGATVDLLLAKRTKPTSLEQRPPRIALPENVTERQIASASWHRAHYLGVDAVGGFMNAKGSATMDLIVANLAMETHAADFRSFMAAPGLVFAGDASSGDLADCVLTADCGGVSATPIYYSPGKFTYRIVLDAPRTLTLNDAYYDGWQAEVCYADDRCEVAEPRRSEQGLIELDGPEGKYDLRLEYTAPGRDLSNLLFVGGIVLTLGAAVAGTILSRRVLNAKLSRSPTEEKTS